MNDDRGQVSLEYMLIFTVSLIILIVFTLPMTELAIEDTLDVSDTLAVKSDLSKISQAIKQVYGEGQGSRQTVVIDSQVDIKVNVASSYVSSSLKLKDGTKKTVSVNFKSNLESSAISLNKGENIIVVEWPEKDENMIIYSS